MIYVFNARLAQTNLITKTDFDTKLSTLNRKIAQNKTKHLLVENKISDVSSLVKKIDYNTKVSQIDDEFVKIKSFFGRIRKNFLSYVSGNILFDGGDGSQPYLVFQPVHKYIKTIANTKYISE